MASLSFYQTIVIVGLFWSQGHGQEIRPTPTIQGQVDDFVLIMCESFIPGQSSSNRLQIYQPGGSFMTFESSRLNRNNEVGGSISNFTFGPLTADDNGTVFRCSSSSRVSLNSTINVIFPPTITRVSPVDVNLNVLENEPFSVIVNISANPEPVPVWSKDGNPITNPRISTTLTSIDFNPVLREDAGFYLLTVVNSAGRDTHNFTLDVMYKPQFIADHSVVFNCSESGSGYIECASYPGVDGMLLCQAEGNPLPTVNVNTDNVSDTSNVNFGTGSEISFMSVASGNAGCYICNASSSIGFDTREFCLFVGGVPVGLGGVTITINETNRYVLVTVVYDNSVNRVPAKLIHSTVTCMTNSMTVVRKTSPVAASVVYNVSFDQLSGCRDFEASATVENIQGNSTAVAKMFMVNGVIVFYGSPLLSLLLLVVAMLFY